MDPSHTEPRTQLMRADAAKLGPPQRFLPPIHGPVVQDSTLGDYYRILLKQKSVIIASVLIVVTLVTIATFRMTPLYEASARIAISKEDSGDNLRINNQGGETDYSFDYNIELDTQAKIIQSDTLALRVIDDLHLGQDRSLANAVVNTALPRSEKLSSAEIRKETQALGVWHGSLAVNKIPRTRMIEIRYTSPDPKLAAQVVNTLASVYIENNYRARYESTMQASEWLSKQLTDLQLKVETSQAALVKYQRKNGIVGIDEKQNTITSKLDQLNRELTTAEDDRLQKQANYQLLSSSNLESIPELSQNGLIQRFREDEGALKKQLAQATSQFGPSYPKVIELNSQVTQIEVNIKNEIDRIASRKGSEYQAALSRENMLRGAFDAQKQEANLLNEKSIAYNALKHDADSNRQLYDGLLQKLKEAGINSGLKSSNVRIVDVARAPLSPAKPNIPNNIALGFLLGLVGGIALAFVLESLDNTVRTPEQVETLTSLPSLGMIPLSLDISSMKNSAKTKSILLSTAAQTDLRKTSISLLAHARPKSEVAESYRALRTSILLSSIGSAPKVIMVTSALPQEGKTTTSINTAIVLAQKGGKVLLVDADMRRPSIHQTFELRNRSGLSTILTGSNTTEEVVVASPILPNLFVLPAGPPPPHPAELLGSEVMRNLLNSWRDQYDHIIVDTPPVLSVTDAVLLSVEMDTVLLVIRSAQTSKDALRRSRDVLNQVNAKVMGVVVNAIDLQSPDAYYYYYGSNYAGRYYDESAGHS
ncbi:MAG: capsular exopolysaccharide family [Acidobacteriaceae bacterium]|nr:capsular exopolysaccharide family [Acidobacteriaceae bacterium]